MPYNERENKTSNVDYLNKDFNTIKTTLMEYAKTYFPNTYQDFNETSPGMMLIEMSAYVGDVLSFYIDQQYKEMMLPLAEERRNIINIANMLGYKTKAIKPAFVELTFTQNVGVTTPPGSEAILPDYSALSTKRLNPGTQVKSNVNSDIIFETLDYVDFEVSSSSDPLPVENQQDASTGFTTQYKITRKVKAISGAEKTKTFTIGSPQKFLEINIPDTNVIDIVSVTDSAGNSYYEFEYLAQDLVLKEEHYTNTNNDRDTAYELTGTSDDSFDVVPVPYSLEYIRTSKKFITRVNENNSTTLIFGNGILRSGQNLNSEFFDVEQAGLTIPGEPSDFNTTLDPYRSSDNSTLGETPANTTLTVTYRTGGGINSNVSSGELTITTDTNVTVTNEQPAQGGSSGDTIEEIRFKASSHFASQMRCVTAEDYKSRVLSMPAKFGNIAKAYVNRTDPQTIFEQAVSLDNTTNTTNALYTCKFSEDSGVTTSPHNTTYAYYDTCTAACFTEDTQNDGEVIVGVCEMSTTTDFINYQEFQATLNQGTYATNNEAPIPTIDIYTLSYDNNKNLVNVHDDSQLLINIKKYIDRFRIITDEIAIKKGYIVNFGVIFDVVATRDANKADVKLRCINKIIQYFNIDKLQFRQPIYVSDLEYELMGIDGVRAVNYVTLTQQFDYNNDNAEVFIEPLYNYIIQTDSTQNFTAVKTAGYGHQYDFEEASQGGMILPSVTPSVFELKNPNQNIKGVVR